MTASTAALTERDPIALLYPELEAELAVTRKLLGAVPLDKGDWRPHTKSMTLFALATHLVQLVDFANAMAALDVLHFDPAAFKPPVVENNAALLAMFDSKAAQLRASLAQLDWNRLDGTWRMMMGDQAMLEGQRATMIRHMGINHIVHHRAQLGVYLRQLEVKLPGSYGPSADT